MRATRIILSGLVGMVTLLLVPGAMAQVGDCCSEVTSHELDEKVKVGGFPNPFWGTMKTWYSGTFCFPYGIGYACGTQTTVTEGTEVSLSSSFSAQGVGFEASQSFTFSQAFTHTAGQCQRCQLYIRYTNASLHPWNNEGGYGAFSWSSVNFLPSSDTPPGVIPCCEKDLSCPGCQGFGGDGGAGSNGGVGTGGGPSAGFTTTIDLAGSFSVLSGGNLDPDHPLLSAVSNFADLTNWHRCQLVDMAAFAQIQAAEDASMAGLGGVPPLTEIAIVNEDGTTINLPFGDLGELALVLPCCRGDFNDDATVNVSDLLALLSAWGDCPACVEDIDNSGTADVGDLLELLSNWGDCAPPPTGACCFSDGSCAEMTAVACSSAGGDFGPLAGCAAAQCFVLPEPFVYDTGVSTNGVGVIGGGVIGWAHRFDAGAGDTITSISTTYGTPLAPGSAGVSAGEPVGFAVMADSGNGPSSVIWSGVSAIDGSAIDSDIFQTFSVPNVPVAGTFFVVVWVEHASGGPGPMDENVSLPDDVWVIFTMGETFGGFDPENPGVAMTMTDAGLPTVWMLRANE